MIRGLVRLALVGGGVAWAIDRWLAARPGAAPLAIVSEVDIDAPPEIVWERIADVERQPEWMNDLKRVTVLTGTPIGQGTRAIGTVRILGMTIEDPIVITAFEPPVLYAIEHRGLFKGRGVVELAAVASGTGRQFTTHVRWTESLVPPVLPHFGSIVQRPVLGAVFQADLDRLKAQVEADRRPAAAGDPA